ncbi:MAG: hypothetical protein KKC11_03840 [Candidatus Omnitrophica bacterium]|nr:hypothetical protein [Candidatus Omnitrophota bacterium]
MQSEKCKGKRYEFCGQVFNFNFCNLQFAFCIEYSEKFRRGSLNIYLARG